MEITRKLSGLTLEELQKELEDVFTRLAVEINNKVIPTIDDYATAAEIDTGTEDEKMVAPDQLALSTLGLHPVAATGAEHGATKDNTANMIVRRDGSGNFSAGTITASLTGNVTGNCSGSSGSCTGNALTSSSCSGNAATATSAAACSGNTAGSSGSCTGNAATATNADKVDGFHFRVDGSNFQMSTDGTTWTTLVGI